MRGPGADGGHDDDNRASVSARMLRSRKETTTPTAREARGVQDAAFATIRVSVSERAARRRKERGEGTATVVVGRQVEK